MKILSRLLSIILTLGLIITFIPSHQAQAEGSVIYIDNLQPSWTAPGGVGVYSGYYTGPYDSRTIVSPGSTSVFDGREAGIIKAGFTTEEPWDEGILAFKVNNVDIAVFASQALTYDVQNQSGVNPVWVRIRLVTGEIFQFWPEKYGAGWHTIDAAAGLWQLMDENGNGTGDWMSLSALAVAIPTAKIDRVYLTMGMGPSYNVSPGVGTVAWVDKVVIGSVTYDFICAKYWYVSETGADSNEGTFASPFATIQHAIESAKDGDTVNVFPGTYTIPGPLTLNKPNLTLKSTEGAARTTIQLTGTGLYNGVEVLANMGIVTIDGFTVKDFTQDGIKQSYVQKQGTVFHVLNNIVIPKADYLRNGIEVTGDGSTVIGNTVNGMQLTPDWASCGIQVDDASNVEVKNNIIIGDATKGVDNGICVAAWDYDISNVIIKENQISNSNYAAINVSTNLSAKIISNLTIQDNSLTNSPTGIGFYGIDNANPLTLAGEISILENNISSSSEDLYVGPDVIAGSNLAISATPNWWGQATGPKIADIVSDSTSILESSIDFIPWCTNEACTKFGPDANGVIELGPGTINVSGGIEINVPHLTILLKNGTVIQNSSPCFIINASYTTITTESIAGAKCVPTSGANGINVAAGLENIIIEGIEIDGTGQTTGAGINFAGEVTDVQVVNSYIHNLSGSGLVFGGAVSGVADIQGNLITSVAAPAVNSGAALNAEFNSWGAYTGAGTIANVDSDPWTHVQLFLTSTGTPWDDQVVNGQNITYIVSADLQNINGAEFTLMYDPTKLQIVGDVVPTDVFDPMPTGTSTTRPLITLGSGEIKYAGWKLAPVSGLNQELFRVTFKALAAGTSNVFIDPVSDVFGMSPDSGPSNNVYAAALDTASVKAIDLPAISSTDIQGYYLVGEQQPFSVSLSNPATGGTYAGVLVDLQVTGADLADITSLYYWETALEPDAFTPWTLIPVAGNLVGSFGPPTTGFPMVAPYIATTPFLVTFANAGSYPVVLNLRDVATGTILATYTNTGVVYEKPVITSPDLAGPYVVGTPEPVTLTITNPSLMPPPFSLVFNLPAGTTIVYDGVTYTCTTTCPPIPVTLPLASNDLPFTFTFPAPFSGDITATLFDSDWTPAPPRELASLTVAANATVIYTVTGSFTVQESLAADGFFNAYYTGIPVVLTKQETPVGYVYNGITSYPEGQNLSITNVMPGNYKITTNQPRVLNVTAGQNKLVNITGDRDLAPLMLIRGNAFWRDPFTFVPDTIINVQDAGLVGYFFNATGDLDADVNFDGIVNVFDLSIVGGNFDMRSAVVYGGTNWIP